MTIKRAWEYMRDHLLSETACSDLEPDGKLALAIISDTIENVDNDDTEYCLADFMPDEVR